MLTDIKALVKLLVVDGVIKDESYLEDKVNNWLDMDIISKETRQSILDAVREVIEDRRDNTIEHYIDACTALLDNRFFDDDLERESISSDLGYYICKKEHNIPVNTFDKDLYKKYMEKLSELEELGDRR